MFYIPPPIKLRKPVGPAQANDPEDVQELQTALWDVNRYPVSPRMQRGEFSAALAGALRRFLSEVGLPERETVKPGDDAALALAIERQGGLKSLRPKSARENEPADLDWLARFRLNGSVGRGRGNDPADLRRLRRGLALVGLRPAGDFIRPAPAHDDDLDASLVFAQKLFGTKADGWAAPDGPTERGLRRQLRAEYAGRLASAPARRHRAAERREEDDPDWPLAPRGAERAQTGGRGLRPAQQSNGIEAKPLPPPFQPGSSRDNREAPDEQWRVFDIFPSDDAAFEAQVQAERRIEDAHATGGNWATGLVRDLAAKGELLETVGAILGKSKRDWTAAETTFLVASLTSVEALPRPKQLNDELTGKLGMVIPTLPGASTKGFAQTWAASSQDERRGLIETLVVSATEALGLPNFGVTFGAPKQTATGDRIEANAPMFVTIDGRRPLSDGIRWNVPIELYGLPDEGDDALRTVFEEVMHRYQQSLVADLYAGRLRQDPDRRLLAQWLAMSFAGYYSVDSAEGLAYENKLAERHAKYIAEKVVEGFPQ